MQLFGSTSMAMDETHENQGLREAKELAQGCASVQVARMIPQPRVSDLEPYQETASEDTAQIRFPMVCVKKFTLPEQRPLKIYYPTPKCLGLAAEEAVLSTTRWLGQQWILIPATAGEYLLLNSILSNSIQFNSVQLVECSSIHPVRARATEGPERKAEVPFGKS